MLEGFVVLGCGSIGQRHIRNLRALGVRDISAFDPVPERMAQVVRDFQVLPCSTLEQALSGSPRAVLVCTPPHLHTLVAHKAINAGAHVFIEKPMANSLDGLDELLQTAAARQRLIYVGYNLRFHAGLIKLKELLDQGAIGRLLVIRAEVGQYLPDWRPSQDYRAGYNVSAAMGGGIILDASHELDYVSWLGGQVQTVYCVAGHLSNLEMETEDTAAITLRLVGGIIAELHLDCIQRGYSRSCKLIGEQGTLVWDYESGVRLLTPEKEWRDWSISPDPNAMYVAEMKHFLACLQGREHPRVDGETGRRVLQVAVAAKESAATGAEIAL